MTILRKHPRLLLLAVLMPIPMVLSVDLKEPFGQLVFFGTFFAVMVPMLIVRAKGELTMSEFMTVGGIMFGSWTILVFARPIIFGIFGK
jgi:hypothetical protein